MEMPVIVIRPGGIPEFATLPYEQQDGQWEPTYEPLKAMLGCDMIEHVSLDAGVSLWCDEEGRLSDDAKPSCIVNAARYAGDIAGPCIVAIDMSRNPFDAFAMIDDEYVRTLLARKFLFTFGRTYIGPVPEDYVLAEPKIEILPMCSECMGPIRPDESSIVKDGREIHADCEKGGAA